VVTINDRNGLSSFRITPGREATRMAEQAPLNLPEDVIRRLAKLLAGVAVRLVSQAAAGD
jgi:hypothetical protein